MPFYDSPLVVDLEVESDQVEFEFDIEQSIVINDIHGDIYDGSYEVTPRAYNEVILETKDKTMQDDVTIRRVPYFETSNESGGYTVYIGEYNG